MVLSRSAWKTFSSTTIRAAVSPNNASILRLRHPTVFREKKTAVTFSFGIGKNK